jgi:hypothetical protein
MIIRFNFIGWNVFICISIIGYTRHLSRFYGYVKL